MRVNPMCLQTLICLLFVWAIDLKAEALYSFKTWTTEDGLPQNSVSSITQTVDGYLWVSTLNGIARFDGVRFVEFNKTYYPDMISNRLTSLSAAGNVLFLGDFNGQVGMYDEGSFRTLSDHPVTYGDIVYSLAVTDNGDLEVMRFQSGKEIIEGNWQRSLPVDPPARSELSNRRDISDVVIDQNGQYWVGSRRSGIEVSSGNSLTTLSSLDGLPTNAVSDLFVDHEGNIWAGTFRGLIRIKPRAFQTYGPEPGTSLLGLATSVQEFNGRIILGVRGGGLFEAIDDKLIPVTVPSAGITSLMVDKVNRLWIGLVDGRVLTTPDLLEFDELILPITGREKRVYAIFEDSRGEIWFGTTKGLLRKNEAGISHLTTEDGLAGNSIRAIDEDSQGRLWFGSQDHGLSMYQAGRFTNYTTANGLSDDSTWELHIDDKDVVWHGSFGGGMTRIENNSLTNLNVSNGLWHDIAGSMISDAGRLWVGSGSGVFSLDRDEMARYAQGQISSYHSTTYSRGEGIRAQESTGGHQTSAIRASDGKYWFVTIEGLVSLDTARLRKNLEPPPVAIEQIVVDGDTEAVVDGRVTIAPGGEHFEFHYTGLSFQVPEQVRFRYRLSGYESAWVNAGQNRVANYTLLPPGDYEFQSIAANNDGVWNLKGATVGVTVLPFFWQTLWFQLLVLLAAGLGIALGVRYIYLQRIRAQRELIEREQMVKVERSRIARDLHDDIGARLTQLGMMLDSGSPGEAVRDKTHQMALAMDEVVWSVDPERDTTEDLVDYIANYTEEFLAPTGIRQRFDIDQQWDNRSLAVKQRHALFSCVKEALNNAVKHSGCTTITVGVRQKNDQIEISVTDDGAGFDAEAEMRVTQSGVVNMTERMKSINGSATFASDASGTRIVFGLEVPRDEAT